MKHALTLMVALVLIVPVAAMAGDYHSGVTLNCSDCHVMHGSQSHSYAADGVGTIPAIGGAQPYKFLLRNESNQLCLTCHDGQSTAPDVLHLNFRTAGTEGRAAGALNTGNATPYFNATGHTLGSTDIAPGGTWNNALGLKCVDCHAAHGTGTAGNTNPYRNLATSATGTRIAPVSYATATNDLTKSVFQRTATLGAVAHYDLTNLDYNEPSATASDMGTFCKACHTNFHGSASDANMRNQTGPAGKEWLRHPTANANIGAIGVDHSSLTQFATRIYRPKVMSPTGNWGTQGVAFATPPADLTPSCFTCHAAHGSTNSFGLKNITGGALVGENGDGGTFRETCRACHVQGS